MNIKHPLRIIIAVLLIAWSFDYLFWKKIPGISFLLFILLVLFGAVYVTRSELQRPARNALTLLPITLLFAGMTFIRLEPMTVFLDVLIVLSSLIVLAMTWLGGKWTRYQFPDYALQSLRLVGGVLAKPWGLFNRADESTGESYSTLPTFAAKTRGVRPILSIILGLVIAFPIVALLAGLLSSADQVFAARFKDLLTFLRLEDIPEYILRAILILFIAFLLCGAYLHALMSSRDEKLIDPDMKIIPEFLGWLEASTILFCVNLLFAFFVAIQFGYFFGGQGNISLEGFTYAEYARRGFGELVVVATLSMLLFLSLSTVTHRPPRTPRWVFTGMGVGLLLLVAVILVSAFQRLNLYESVYGFTRLRLYTHTFMIWLGLLLAATVGLEISGRLRHFALICALIWLGFGASMNALNVDALIVARNVKRAQMGFELDVAYLTSLSPDSVPALVNGYNDTDLPHDVREDIGAVFACRSALEPKHEDHLPWQSYHLSRARAQTLLAEQALMLEDYTIVGDRMDFSVRVNGRTISCVNPEGWDSPN